MKKNQQKKFLLVATIAGIFSLLMIMNQIFLKDSKIFEVATFKNLKEPDPTTDVNSEEIDNTTEPSTNILVGDFSSSSSDSNKIDPSLKEFQDLARLEIELPNGLRYVPLDLEDGMASLYAYDTVTNVGITLFAAPRTAEQAEALSFAKDISKFIPNFKDNPILQISETPTALPASDTSGLKDATWWQGKTQTGDEVHIVLLPRKDDKGTYLIVGGGPAAYFEGMEENFEKSLATLKALPR
jgi:hypothetical protein